MTIATIPVLTAFTLLFVSSLLPVGAQQATPAASVPGPQFTMMSSGFGDGGDLPVKYSCDGKPNPVNPALQWSNVPKGTVTLALVFHDPDAATAKGMWDITHWVMWNIPASLTQLPEGVPAGPPMPDGTTQGKNILGTNGYRGPCPSGQSAPLYV